MAASKSIVNVFVDCDWGKKNTDLSTKYGVRGYPTVIFTNPKGELIEPLGDRSPAGVKTQIEKIGKSAKPAIETYDAAAEIAKKDGKLVLYFFATKGKDSEALQEALFDESLQEAVGKFVVVQSLIKRDNADAKRFAVVGFEQPVVLVLDPNAEKPEAQPLKKIVGKKTPKELLKEFMAIKMPEKKQ